jgi:hypothetical protein
MPVREIVVKSSRTAPVQPFKIDRRQGPKEEGVVLTRMRSKSVV